MTQVQFSINFVLAVLATWRVTHLLANEDGPADLIVKLRVVLGNSLAGSLMDCFQCLSLWIAAPAALFVTRNPLEWLMVWLALSAAACLLERFGPEAAAAQPQLQPDALQQDQTALMQQFLQEEKLQSEKYQGEKHHVLWPETIRTAEHQLSPDDREHSAASQPGSRSTTHANDVYRA